MSVMRLSSLPVVLVTVIGVSLATLTTGQYTFEQRGQRYAEDQSFGLYFVETKTGDYVSPWHDVPLYSEQDKTNQTLNLIVEIPRFSQAKFEIHREFKLNPIKQDVSKDGNLRYLSNIFPWHGAVCNYGAFPQTWENPFHKDTWTGQRGDKDPLDVCEVGSLPVPTGTVLPVRVLGILGLLDSGETDWKVIVMNAEEADKKGIKDMETLREKSPGIAEAVKRFFTVYKVPSGGTENKFAYNGEIKGKELADDVIQFLHEEWKEMMHNCTIANKTGEFGSFNTANTQISWSPCVIDRTQAKREVQQQPQENPVDAPRPSSLHSWSFVKDKNMASTSSYSSYLLLVILLCVFNSIWN